MMKEILDQNTQFQEKLFIRGYLISENCDYNTSSFPFYGNWEKTTLGNFSFYVHCKQKFTHYNSKNTELFIIGECLNPFDSLYNEHQILEKLASKLASSLEDAIQYINGLTGSFLLGAVQESKLYFLTDPTGMLFGCYGTPSGSLHISSHAQLIADLCPLTKSEYIQKFEKYRYFYKYGLFFPGDLTQYSELHRILQNHIFCFDGKKITYKRFYPSKEIQIVKNDEEYHNLVKESRNILGKTLELASKKWSSIAISLTGGMDSKTTLACTNGFYDCFQYYSYISMAGDKIDADAAKIIARHVGIPHTIYHISENDQDFDYLEIQKAILEHNNGGYHVNANDVRKRVYFSNHNAFQVEVKSWISEIARANYYKKFGLKKMPLHLSPRNMTSMFKIFTTQRGLAKETDKIFSDFIQKTNFHHFPEGYDESDMYLWEFRYSAWGGIVITSEHSYSNDIFIPYNNRTLLDLMLHAPLEKRISDQLHEDIICCGNSKIHEAGITVTNWNETKKRMYLEKAYFRIMSLLKWF